VAHGRSRNLWGEKMEELIRTNDIVLLSYLQHRLREAGIEPFVADVHTSIMEGSIGMLPRRLMVVDDDLEAAKGILADVNREQQSE
jgi:hypothetical protein